MRLSVGLFVAALFCRTWLLWGLIVPMQIAGDSMAETLVGPHHQVTCAKCDHDFKIGHSRQRADDVVVCPRCGESGRPAQVDPLQPGQTVLIDRTAFQFRQPRRWELVVFRCPQGGNELCVKRVVGLPGESVQIRNGNIYADGQLCRKDLGQQRAVRQRVDRVAHKHAHSRWAGERPSTAWRQRRTHFVIQSRDTVERPPAIDWLVYRHGDGRPITDDSAYNQNVRRRLNDVADVTIDGCFQIDSQAASADGELILSMADFRDQFEVQITPATGATVLKRNGQSVWQGSIDIGVWKRPVRLELSLFDHQVLLACDGRVCFAYPYDISDQPRRPTSSPMAIGVRGLSLTVDRLTVWRDLFYGPLAGGSGRHGLAQPCLLGPDSFFVLGDNSPISLDSRVWPQPGLAAKFLVGKPLGFE